MKLIIPRYSFLFVLAGFIISIFCGTMFLQIPGMLQEGTLSFINALFVSVSSVTCTGVTPIPISYFSWIGKSVIIILMYVGSIGLLTLLLGLIFYFAFHAITWYGLANEILEIIAIKQLSFFFRIMFLLSGVVISGGALFFYFTALLANVAIPLIDAIFITVNFFCNVGYSIVGLFPEILMNTNQWYIISSIIIMSGSIGFLTLFEIIQYAKKESQKQRYVFSMTFVLMIKMYFLTLVFFWLFYMIFCESNVALINVSRSLFASVSLRACGVCPYLNLPNSIIFITALYGILGSGPLGTGGGIKTSIIGIIAYTFMAFFKKDNNVIVKNKKISWIMIAYAHMFLIYIIFFALLLSIVVDLHYNYDFDFILIYADLLGLVTGSGALWTPFIGQMTTVMKIIAIVVMGMAKISTILFSLSLSKLKKNTIKYPEAKLIVI